MMRQSLQLHLRPETFRLPQRFIDAYDPGLHSGRHVAFGFNGVGEIAYRRSYARVRDSDGKQEVWHQTVERVVNGCFTMLRRHFAANDLRWDAEEQTTAAQKMYDKIFNFKFLPPGRGLWAMGTKIT